MAFQVSPAVQIVERDLTTVIPAVSTTEGAFAGHFRWGPVDQRVLIDSENTLERTFASPTGNSAVDFMTATNFLSYSNALFTVRVVNRTSGSGTVATNASANATGAVYVKSSDDYVDNYSTGINNAGTWAAKYPGELGNSIKVSVCPSSNAWASTLTGNVAITSNTTTLYGNGTLFTTEVTVGDYVVIGPDRTSLKVRAINSNFNLTLVSRYSGNTVTMDDQDHLSDAVERRWEYYNFFDTAPGTSSYANTVSGTADELHVVVEDEDGVFTGTRNTILERYEAVSFASDAKKFDGSTNYYVDVINQQSQYIWWGNHNSSNGQAGQKALNKTFTGGDIPQNNSLTGGKDGILPPPADYIRGYNLFSNPEEIDISFIIGGQAGQTLALHLINNIAEVRKDCLVCVSPLRSHVVANDSYPGKQTTDQITYFNLFPSSSYYVKDNNWKYQYDKYNDIYRYIPLNGDIAGLMARTDQLRDPWFSPAGYNRGNVKNVIKLAYNPNKAERDLLYKAGINPVVTFPGQGTVLFGDKTGLAQPSAFNRINVRRLFIVLEKAIATASKFTLFELNNSFTRLQFRNLVEPFLRDVQGREGIIDFRVVCDETNNTPEVIDRNEFVGSIFIKPARSINYITLNFVAVRTGVDFEEVVQRF